jgi:phenylacetate-CoA ligase
VHSWLVPRVIFPVYERLTGRRVWTHVQELRALQWRSPDELAARAAGRLRALLIHAQRHVPFYREQFAAAGVDAHAIQRVEDLARLPVTTKAALRARLSDTVVAGDLAAARRFSQTTSGSTGFPLEVLGDRASADETLASYLLFLEWAGAALWQTRVDLGVRLGRSFHRAPWLPASPGRLLRRLALGGDVRGALAPDLTVAALRALVADIPARRGYFIRAYPAYAAEVAARLVADGGGLPAAPRVVISCSETLTAARRALIERAFGAPVVNHYSSWEALHLAQTCPDHPAVLHVNSERAVVRVVRADGTPAATGERGRLLLTVLSNRVQPFVNYDIGDWGALAGPCPCGRGWPTLAGLEGRTSEAIRTPSGRIVSAILVNQLPVVSRTAEVWEYQAEQTAPDRVVFRVVPAPRFTPATATALRAELGACLGEDVALRIEVVDRIPPEPSGKRPVIVTRLPGAGADTARV